MLNFRERLAQGPILFDGAMGTQIQAMGLEAGGCPEQWNLKAPDKIKQIHQRYLEAGSEVVTTNTFGGNRFKLEGYNLGAELTAINREGVCLARQVQPDHYVAASIGPTGQFLAPMGSVTTDQMRAVFEEQVKALLAGDPDLFLIETMMDVNEARLALEVCQQVSDKPVGVTMAFNLDRNGYRTMMGQTPQDMLTQLPQADFIGANCGNGPAEMLGLVEILAQATDKPILIQANAGVPQLIEGRTVYSIDAPTYVELSLALLKAGARLIGGCCGTNPDYIRRLGQALHAANS